MSRVIMILVVSLAFSLALDATPQTAAQEECPGAVVATGGTVAGSCAIACVGASARANANAMAICPRHCQLGRATTIGRDCRKVARGYRCFITHSYPCT